MDLTVIASAKAMELLENTISSLASEAKSSLKEKFQKWRTQKELSLFRDNIRQIGKITTIASRQASTIDEIYYPAKIKLGKTTRTVITTEDLLSKKTRLAPITGTAGQGKSVFLRYLCLQDIDILGRIPIFVELRKIDNSITLQTLIKQQLETLGIENPISEQAAELLLKSLHTRLYLDGFDELNREHALRTKDEITSLLNKNPNLQIAVTSRPGALSQYLVDAPQLQQYEIAPLTERDYPGFFAKIGVDAETLYRLISAIEKSKAQIRSLLSTPLMLTLLAITCGTKQDLPDTLPDFYDSLFNLLSSMHDGTKPGFIRQKATNLGNTELEALFSAFAFSSKELFGRVSLNPKQFEDSFNSATKITDIRCTVEGFRTDFTETICLLAKEGLDTTFIHKSIQEYYAAYFIHRHQDDAEVRLILESTTKDHSLPWLNELRFLEDFQNRAYEQLIGIPHADQLTKDLTIQGRRITTISKTKVKSLLRTLKVRISLTRTTKKFNGLYWTPHITKDVCNRYIPDLVQALSRDLSSHFGNISSTNFPDDRSELISIVVAMNNNSSIEDRVMLTAQKFCESLSSKSKKMSERQSRKERGLLDLLQKARSGQRLN